jgi:hypothetical protein
MVTVQPQLAARTQQETTMHPSTSYHLGQAASLTGTSKPNARTNHASRLSPGHLTTILARRVRAALGTPAGARRHSRGKHQRPRHDQPASAGPRPLHPTSISGPRPRTTTAHPTSQEIVMNPNHRTRRLSVTVAGLATAAALALPAAQGTATAATLTPPPPPGIATAQPAQTGLTAADLEDIAKVKRDLFWTLAKRSPRR